MPEKLATTKEVAGIIGCDVRTLRKKCKQLGVEPTIGGSSWHKWSPEDVRKLIAAMQADSQTRKQTDQRYAA